jgi:diguanylate cyclase (GGDEF)-like protein
LEGKLNILNDENRKEQKNYEGLRAKVVRYNSLKEIVEHVNAQLELDTLSDTLASIAFSLIANNKGVCVLYLADYSTHKLNLFKTKKEDNSLVIKHKQGDIFDNWVLRHTSPLLIEDIKKDFRFDLGKLKQEDLRPISSLVSSALMSENKFLGVLRLDNPQPNYYSQEDLRLLLKICDLGAVALENSELFQRTQDLAIHDCLTETFTKGYFLERLKEECLRGMRQKSEFSLLMLDIDFFKNYNDKYGHTAGDIVLKKLGKKITEFSKDYTNWVSRFGGEEFCIILEETGKKKAYNLAKALCKEVEKEKIILRRQETYITVSIGVASFPQDAFEEIELIQKADKAMYLAKQKGRNRSCCT